MTTKAVQEKRKSLGLCPRCGKPVDGDTIKCRACASRNNADTKKGQLRYKRLHLCVTCGKPANGEKVRCLECQEQFNAYERQKYQQVKDEVYLAYGGYRCVCCGETHPEFLTIDHINGGGNQHRHQVVHGRICVWLKRNNYPEGYQVLCHNCNFAKYKYGVCPHKKERINAL